MTALAVTGLRKEFTQHLLGGARREVLSGADVSVEPGECVVVAGPSGSGKSSLLRCIYRTYRPDGGSALVGEDDLATADERTVVELRRTRIGMAAQFLQVVPRLSALSLVMGEGLEREPAAELLLELGLSMELLDAPPATFSGGERQIVNLAMAFARRRPVVLLDEVTASLDTNRRDTALRLLRREKESGIAMLAVFHTIPQLDGFVDRVVQMRDGRLAA
jgi:alpha-D-ribose 1-methylphosphonate 5-triphosphate synthase subunit PhnL